MHSAASASAPSIGTPAALVGPVDFGFGQLVLEVVPELALPRLRLTSCNAPITTDGVRLLLDTFDHVFALRRPLTIFWDVRACSIPSRAQIKIALEWVGQNCHLLDEFLQGICVALSSMIVRAIVNFIMRVCQPPQPHFVGKNADEALAFAAQNCQVAKQWVGASAIAKKKQRALKLEAAAAAKEASKEASARAGSPRQSPRRGAAA